VSSLLLTNDELSISQPKGIVGGGISLVLADLASNIRRDMDMNRQ